MHLLTTSNTLCQDRNLHQITGSRIVRIQADGGGEFNNQKLNDLCFDNHPVLPTCSSTFIEWNCRENGRYVEEHSPEIVEAGPLRARMGRMCKFAGHMMREKVLGRPWQYPLFGQLVGIWKGRDKDQAKSLDDRGAVGHLLDIDIWQSGTTRIMQDGRGGHSGEGLST